MTSRTTTHTVSAADLTVSVVLPSFRAAPIAAETVPALIEILEACFPSAWEVIVVDDGGGDFPPAWAPDSGVTLISLERNRGKGNAVRTGMLSARGRARIYTDIDLPYDPWLIPVIVEYLLEDGHHLVMGDRRLPDSTYEPPASTARALVSSFSAFLTGTLVTGGFFDTQCGLKGVRGDVTELLFPLVRTDRFAFDIEVVYLALRFNCSIKRIPVTLGRPAMGSTVKPLLDSMRSIIDLARIKFRAMSHAYECPTLHVLVNGPHRERLSRAKARGRAR